jgi:hypothetical protein
MAKPRQISITTDAAVKTIVFHSDRHHSGSASKSAKLSRPTKRAAARSKRVASVKLNQIVRASGHSATAASAVSIGATSIQAVPARRRARRSGRVGFTIGRYG